MAAQKKTAEVDYSMQEKILALYELQKIDSKIDEINKIKGELPLEVQDLEDELAGLNTRIEHINGEIEELNALTKQRKREVDQAKILIGNYKEQQNNVRNNREFDAITKEIEYQELEIELAEKRLKEYAAAVKAKKALLEETEGIVADRKADLEVKQGELKSIEEETASQVAEFGEAARIARQLRVFGELAEQHLEGRRSIGRRAVGSFKLLAAEKFIGRRKRARVEFAEDVVDVDDLAVIHLEFEAGALELRFEHRNVEAGDVVAAEVAAVDVVEELFGDERKDRALLHIVVGDAVNRGRPGRNRHFRIQPPHGILGAAVREHFQHGDFDDAVALRHDSGAFDIEYDQRPFELQFI